MNIPPKRQRSTTSKESKSSSLIKKAGFKKGASTNKTEGTVPRIKLSQSFEPNDIKLQKKGIYFENPYYEVLAKNERLEMVNILKSIINTSNQEARRDNNTILEQILNHPGLSNMDPDLLKIMASALLNDSRLLNIDSGILGQIMGRKPEDVRDMLNFLGKSLKLLEEKSDNLEKIIQLHEATDLFSMSNAEDILRIIVDYPLLLDHIDKIIQLHKATNLFSLSNAEDILEIIGRSPELLEHIDKIIQFKLFSMPNALEILRVIRFSPELLEHIDKIIQLHEATNLFSMPNAEDILIVLRFSPVLLEHIDKIIQFKLFSMPNALEILRVIRFSPEFLEHIDKIIQFKLFYIPNGEKILDAIKDSPELLVSIGKIIQLLSISNADKILGIIGSYPSLLKHIDKITQLHEATNLFFMKNAVEILNIIGFRKELFEHIDKIIQLHEATNLFFTPDYDFILIKIADYPELLKQIDKIIQLHKATNLFSTPNSGYILTQIGEYPVLLEKIDKIIQLHKDTDLFSLPNAKDILSAIGRSPELLEHIDKILELKPDFVNKVLLLPNAGKILLAVAEHLEILELVQPDFIDKILAFPHAAEILSAIVAFPEILKLPPELMDRMLRKRNLNALKTFSEGLGKYDLLMQYEQLYKKFEGQVGKYFESIVFPYLILRSEQLKSKSGGPFLNISRILKDPDAAMWNNLPRREQNLSDADWENLCKDLNAKMLQYFPEIKNDAEAQAAMARKIAGIKEGDEVSAEDLAKAKAAIALDITKRMKMFEHAIRWFKQIPHTMDGQLGLQVVRKRVASIIDYIKKQKDVDPSVLASEAFVDKGVEIAKELIRILAEGGEGTRCPDAAAEALEEAEFYAMAFGHEGDFVMNIIVNLWKRRIIPAKLVNYSTRESVEIKLAYLKLLNGPLGLESKMVDMLHEEMGQAKPLAETMKIVYDELNEDSLIDFAMDHPLMQSQFKIDSEALQEFEKLLDFDFGPLLLESERKKGQDEEANLDKYIERVKNLMIRATSVEAVEALKEWIDATYYTDRDELLIKYPVKGAELDNLVLIQLPKLLPDFKRDKTKSMLKEGGFLSDTANYEDPNNAYWKQ